MEKKIGKWDIAKSLAEKVDGMTQKKAGEVIDAVAEIIVDGVMEDGADVNIPKLGTFKKKVLAAHKGFNPLTKTPIQVPETHNIAFKPNATIKRVVEEKKTKGKK